MDGRRIVVTGGAGFIGSHLVEALVALGDRVTVIDAFDDYYDPAAKERNLAAVVDRIALVRADCRDLEAVVEATRGADAVVHLAARAGVRPSIQDPRPYVRANVEGTQTLLLALREAGVERLLVASSSSVYGARTRGPFREDDPLSAPESPYAATKRAAEVLCEAWRRLHGTRIGILRFFTVYGPRQRPDMAIHRFLSSVLEDREITVFGDGSSSRDYTYVADVVAGVIAALDADLDGEVVNLGNSHPVRLDALVEAVGRAAGRSPRIRRAGDQPGDVPLTWADVGRAATRLGWAPTTPLDDGLTRFATWLRAEARRT